MDYFICFLDTDGRVTSRIGLVSASDEEAVKKASQLVVGHPAELWLDGRLVHRLHEVGTSALRNIH